GWRSWRSPAVPAGNPPPAGRPGARGNAAPHSAQQAPESSAPAIPAGRHSNAPPEGALVLSRPAHSVFFVLPSVPAQQLPAAAPPGGGILPCAAWPASNRHRHSVHSTDGRAPPPAVPPPGGLPGPPPVPAASG